MSTTTADNRERNARIVALRTAGKSFAAIAAEVGVSEGAAWGVCRRAKVRRPRPAVEGDRLPRFLDELAPLVDAAERAAVGQLVHAAVVPICELVARAQADGGLSA